MINYLLAFQFTTHGSCLVMKTRSSPGQESLPGWGLWERQSKTCSKAPQLKCISLKSQARLGYFIQAFRSLSAYYQIWRGSEVYTMIAALNDAACAQLRKGDSDDLSDYKLRTHTHTQSYSDCSIEKHRKRSVR